MGSLISIILKSYIYIIRVNQSGTMGAFQIDLYRYIGYM
jgi:hypothetical protein